MPYYIADSVYDKALLQIKDTAVQWRMLDDYSRSDNTAPTIEAATLARAVVDPVNDFTGPLSLTNPNRRYLTFLGDMTATVEKNSSVQNYHAALLDGAGNVLCVTKEDFASPVVAGSSVMSGEFNIYLHDPEAPA